MSVLPTAFQKVLDEQYRKRASQNLVRERRPREEGTLPLAKVNGRTLINFCGNDYLGLSAHETVINAAKTALDTFGFGSGASQLVSGYTTLHRQLEETLAAKTGRDRALVFSTGYMANQAIINSLDDRTYIQCTQCQEWFHLECIGLYEAPISDFYCSKVSCQAH